MEVVFAQPDIEALVTSGRGTTVVDVALVACLRRRVQALLAAPTERELLGLRALDLTKATNGEYSMRVDDEFRINVAFEDRDHVRHAVLRALTHRESLPFSLEP
jgi:plasmid maintenance system killer protein